ncbi:RpiR family transcriptional regulator [Bacillus sp. M6-12]|uniref:MurR/RpiR family transcriptional regulator n=1 Tax=Bacillus sp. M6-12 TaxID=2054166 RepID=UPI000C79191A|nr:MurR/RpiR family transcriptional regulator [Bacillus sp. M6-12]PLS16144.1 RpiR family transcriptional regulator [Bacillus sp. M6-12]
MFNGGLVSIRELMEGLNPSERKVAEFILANPQKVVDLSIQRLAELTGVSEASIIRLTRSLNMKGYKELKLRLMGDLTNNLKDEQYQDINIGGSTESLIQAVSSNNKQSIEDTVAVLSPIEVEKAVKALCSARKIAVYGVGASAVIAEDIKQKFTRIGWWCDAYSDYHSQMTSATILTEQDVAFGVSYSGQTEEIFSSLTEAKKQGAQIITLTRFGPSPIADLSDIKLFTSSVEKSIRSGAMASRIAQLNVIDILFVSIASHKHHDVIPLLEKTRLIVKNTKRA